MNFGAGGGIGTAVPPLTGLKIGTHCTVVEQDTGSFDPSTVITYTPTGADVAPGVTIPDSDVGVTVQITNDFSGVELQPETVVTPTPTPEPAAAVAADPAFTG